MDFHFLHVLLFSHVCDISIRNSQYSKHDYIRTIYCTCTYFSRIHILVELAILHEYVDMLHKIEL